MSHHIPSLLCLLVIQVVLHPAIGRGFVLDEGLEKLQIVKSDDTICQKSPTIINQSRDAKYIYEMLS